MPPPRWVLNGTAIFITSGNGHGCTMLDISKDGPVKRWEVKDMQSQFSSPLLYNGYLYGTTDPGNLLCMNPATGAVVWKQPGFEKGGMVLADGVLIALVPQYR